MTSPSSMPADYYQEVEHPITGRAPVSGLAVHDHAGTSPATTGSPPPTLGQHNEEVLRGLGLTDDEIDDLRARKVIGETALNA